MKLTESTHLQEVVEKVTMTLKLKNWIIEKYNFEMNFEHEGQRLMMICFEN